MKRSIVLLSGGLDSTVNLCRARRDTQVVLALTFDYGQRAAASEIQAARKICGRYAITHQVIELDWLRSITQTALVNVQRRLPYLAAAELDEMDIIKKTAKAVWVPNRNGIFINIAAGFAESLKADAIVVGFNAEEATTFPDNSQAFLDRVNASLQLSTLQRPAVISYTTHLDKKALVSFGKKLEAPFEEMWSCYEAGDQMCGQCESCQRFKRAMTSLLQDPFREERHGLS